MRFLCRFSLILLALIYASSASHSSGDSAFAKVRVISIGVLTNFDSKGDTELKTQFRARLDQIKNDTDIIIISGNEEIDQSMIDEYFMAVDLEVFRSCSEDREYCAIAVFPEGYWSGQYLRYSYCKLVKVTKNSKSELEIGALAGFLIEHVNNCLLKWIFEENQK